MCNSVAFILILDFDEYVLFNVIFLQEKEKLTNSVALILILDFDEYVLFNVISFFTRKRRVDY